MTQHQRWIAPIFLCLFLLPAAGLSAQGVAAPGDPCKPASQRTQQIGCWILADQALGPLARSPVYWHLDEYPTRDAARADQGPRGIVVESMGKVFLMTIAGKTWRSAHGQRVDEIGPLTILPGEKYSAQLMEAIFKPGMTAPTHVHSGPEAWYAVSGETCLETSDGRMQIGRAGGPHVIVPMGVAMHLTATGSEQRSSIVLILHQSSKPATTVVHNWIPKGLCRK